MGGIRIRILADKVHGSYWKPLHGSEIGSRIKREWSESTKNSPRYAIFLKNTDVTIDNCHCVYPNNTSKRPVQPGIFQDDVGCIYDLDGAKQNDYLKKEGKQIPSRILVRCVSATTAGCIKKKNFIGNCINEDNADEMIKEFLGMLLLVYCKRYFPSKFNKIAREDLEAFLNIFEKGTKECLVRYLKSYIFSWDDIPGKDNKELIDFLIGNYGTEWVKTATIEKIDNHKTIKISAHKDFILLKLNEKNELILEINENKTDKLVAKIENNKLNIYKIQE